MRADWDRSSAVKVNKADYGEAVQYIEQIPKFTVKHPLAHTREFINRLGNPAMAKKVIHVAGTNGKGSVCAYLRTMLSAEGKSTGMFISPHLERVNERISICGVDISDQDFAEIFCEVRRTALLMEAEGEGHPSYFEFLFAMAMTAFERSQVEYVILETGLGGRLDATNIVESPLVTVITSIGYDHTGLLGETIAEIAGEKAGIIKPGVPVICDGNQKEALEVIASAARASGSKCRDITKNAFEIHEISDKYIAFSMRNAYYGDTVWRLKGSGTYQPMNAVLALEAMLSVFPHKDHRDRLIRWGQALSEVTWPGRMEEVLPGVILDGAHNIEAVRELTNSIRQRKEYRRPCILLYSVVEDKDYEEAAKCLGSEAGADLIVITELRDARRAAAEDIADVFMKYSKARIVRKDCVESAFQYALTEKGTQGVLYCLGSLYLVGEIKEILKNVPLAYGARQCKEEIHA